MVFNTPYSGGYSGSYFSPGPYKTFEEGSAAYNASGEKGYAECKVLIAKCSAALGRQCDSNCYTLVSVGKTPDADGDPVLYDWNIVYGKNDPGYTINTPNGFLPYSHVSERLACPTGWSLGQENKKYFCEKDKQDQTPPKACPSPLVAHPINAATGNKERFETDYESADGVLKVERHYLNQFSGWTQNPLPKLQDLRSTEPSKLCMYGGMIKYNAYDSAIDAQREYNEFVCMSYVVDPLSNYRVYITLSNGFVARFRETSTNIFSPDNALIGKLRALDPATNNNASWEYTAQDNTKQLFDQRGLLITVVNASGRKINYQYTSFILSRATDDAGRRLNYNYDTNGNVSSITLPDGNSIVYTYQDTPVKGTL